MKLSEIIWIRNRSILIHFWIVLFCLIIAFYTLQPVNEVYSHIATSLHQTLHTILSLLFIGWKPECIPLSFKSHKRTVSWEQNYSLIWLFDSTSCVNNDRSTKSAWSFFTFRPSLILNAYFMNLLYHFNNSIQVWPPDSIEQELLYLLFPHESDEPPFNNFNLYMGGWIYLPAQSITPDSQFSSSCLIMYGIIQQVQQYFPSHS